MVSLMQSTDFDAWKEPLHPLWPQFLEWTERQGLFRSRALWRGFKEGATLRSMGVRDSTNPAGGPDSREPKTRERAPVYTPEMKRAADIFDSGGL